MGRVLAILIVCQLCLGCFVFEELDSGMEMMDKPTFAKKEKKSDPKPAARSTGSPSSSGPSVQQRVASWWNEARSLNSGEVDDNMVACELSGKTQFMGKTDCLARGGKAGKVR